VNITGNHFVRRWSARPVIRQRDRLRILVVDDNRPGAEALLAFLEHFGWDCRGAFGGREGVCAGVELSPEIILMDISMPECNGYEAARALRSEPSTASAIMIAYTALDETEVRKASLPGVFDGYCQKGHAPTFLIDLIAAIVNDANTTAGARHREVDDSRCY
jgi:CheY-like chemotaxis protein